MQLQLIEVCIAILTSIFVGVVIQIHNFGIDIENNKKRPSAIYISEAFMSAICGSLLALILFNTNDNFTVWIAGSIIGSFLGKKSMYMIIKLFLSIIKLTDINIDKIIDEEDGNKKE